MTNTGWALGTDLLMNTMIYNNQIATMYVNTYINIL